MSRASYPRSHARQACVAVPRASQARLRRRHGRTRVAGLLRFAVFLLLIFVAVWAGVRVANASGDSRAFDGRSYEVHAGDTLWSIAAAEYGDAIDLRQAVYDIQRQNGLRGALLQPGQTITLPYEDDAGADRAATQ
jgi:hypothetical protein